MWCCFGEDGVISANREIFCLTSSFCCPQQRGYPGKMPGGQLKRPGPPLGEQSVIQHTPLPSLHPPSRQATEDFPSPSKRRKSSDQVSGDTLVPPPLKRKVTISQFTLMCFVLGAAIPPWAAAFLRPVFSSASLARPPAASQTCILEPNPQEQQPPLAGRRFRSQKPSSSRVSGANGLIFFSFHYLFKIFFMTCRCQW